MDAIDIELQRNFQSSLNLHDEHVQAWMNQLDALHPVKLLARVEQAEHDSFGNAWDYWQEIDNDSQLEPPKLVSALTAEQPASAPPVALSMPSVDDAGADSGAQQDRGTPIPTYAMNKAGMIAAHKHHWPTIERDIKDAGANGLNIAKAGNRDWWEAKALGWARSRGKLTDLQPTENGLRQAINSMASLPGMKHKL